MKCAQPEALAPVYDTYPGGLERSRWHLEKGIECFEHYFGIRPRGVWLSEGAISDDAVELLDDLGFEWTASGEGVWKNTCGLHGIHIDEKDKKALFCPYTIKNRQTRIFFRDDGLSDLIGFEYGKRDTEDAVNDFTYNLANIASYLGDDASDHVISVILDGENAWEYYPDNGYFFLDKLYEQLETYDRINITTFSELINLASVHEFPYLCAGSWVYGTFSTWIGLEEKNRAWEYLIEAKQIFDSVMASDNLDDEKKQKINRMMAICEGSDWFWWFGDYNPASSVAEFDMLFRIQLKTLYTLMGESIPDHLDTPISSGGQMGTENTGTMRRNIS
jgi:alpha-amylase/alpha-mannosidase (GH57 family)